MKALLTNDTEKISGVKTSKPILLYPLAGSKVRYRRLFETARDGILILDAETGKILDVNPFLIELLGYSKEEFIEKEIWEIGFFKDIINSKDKFEELQQKGYVRYENLPLETAQGLRIDAEFISNLYFENDHKLIQCNIRDITKRRKKETGKEKTRRGLALIKKDADEVSEFAENIINTIREPLLLLNKELEVVKASRSFYDFFKVKPEATIGKLIYQLGDNQWNIPKLKELLETVLPEKTTFENYEVEHVFSGIGKRVMLLNARQIKRAFGMEKIILLAFEDITERKMAEETLSEEHRLTSEYLDILFNHAQVPIIIWNAESVITHFNRAFEKLIGYDLANNRDQKLEILFPKDKIDSSLELINNSLKNVFPELIEVEILTRDNSVKTVLWNSSNVFDKDGKRVIATVAQDITNRKRNEEEHRILETRYRCLFESTKDGILILDAGTGKIIDVNPFLIELLSYPKEDFVGKELWEIGLFRDIAANEEKFTELQQKGYVRYDDLPLETADGRKINVEFVSNVYSANNKKVVQCNIRDITERKSAERALIVSESRLRTLVQTIPDLIWTKDLDGVYQSCNTMFGLFFGASEAEIVGKTDYDFVDRELADFFRERDRKTLAAGIPTSNEEWITFAGDGHRACLETIKAPMFDSRSKLIGILGIGRDITQRKNSEKALSQSEEKFRSYIDHAPDGIFVINETGRYLDVNKAACLMSGYSKSEILAMSIPDLLANESLEEGLLLFEELIQHGSSKGDLQFKLKNGSSRWWSLDGVKLNETRFLGFSKDITDRKLAESEIAMLSHSVKSINECVSITDMDDKILFVNESFTETYGYKSDELVGKNISIVRSGNNPRKQVHEILPATIHGEWKGELLNRKKDGTEFPVYLSTSGIKDKSNKVIRLIGVATDITGRKHAEKELVKAKEKAEESDRLKTAFLTNLSHEIRTPMNGILGFTELLKEPMLTGEEQQSYIAIIEKSSARMLNIINDIVSISKIESGEVEVSVSEMNVNKQVGNIFKNFNQEAIDKNILLSIENQLPEEDAMIRTDKEKVFTILTNLVKNALKFTDTGSIKIGYEKKNGNLEFFVKDTGKGISRAQSEFIFERFRQGSESRTRNYEGAGLGLAISKAYAEMLGGTIRLESDIDGNSSEKGSTFFLTIPDTPVREVKATGKTDTTANSQIRKLKILVAEDDETSQMLVSIITRSIGKEVIIVNNGDDAVEASRNNPDIDLVLMDIKMPGMDGYEATSQIRKFNKKVIVIAQTAYALDGDRAKAIEAGCNDNISKPIDPFQLLTMIKSFFVE